MVWKTNFDRHLDDYVLTQVHRGDTELEHETQTFAAPAMEDQAGSRAASLQPQKGAALEGGQDPAAANPSAGAAQVCDRAFDDLADCTWCTTSPEFCALHAMLAWPKAVRYAGDHQPRSAERGGRI